MFSILQLSDRYIVDMMHSGVIDQFSSLKYNLELCHGKYFGHATIFLHAEPPFAAILRSRHLMFGCLIVLS